MEVNKKKYDQDPFARYKKVEYINKRYNTDAVFQKKKKEYTNQKLPDPTTNPKLHKIDTEVQLHSRKHSKSCKKGNVLCRYGFPKLPMSRTTITHLGPQRPEEDENEDPNHPDRKKTNQEKYEKHSKEVDEAFEQLQREGLAENAWTAFAPEIDIDRLECIEEQEDVDPEEDKQDDVPEYQILHEDGDGVVPQIEASQMTAEFSSFFYFVSGGAGCGKSHVKDIHMEATKILRQLPRLWEEGDFMPTVLLSAFTVMAAFNISGKMLHSLLKLPRSLKPPYQELRNSLDEVRAGLRNVKILIIDEISMISKDLFSYVNWRFQQIKGSKKPFGGISCLAVGDYYQLPPLGKAKPLCVFEEDVLDFWTFKSSPSQKSCARKKITLSLNC
ncbi:hypothetical protein QQF64_033890 [Cirrhinus molitorella]|uniref:ATP-dependent DNA helicase n=1 Tax=Cirrhinus molitorella TaxID=172907 RepID=A0ABR3MV70_9TELE